jgi:hypothetical protein
VIWCIILLSLVIGWTAKTLTFSYIAKTRSESGRPDEFVKNSAKLYIYLSKLMPNHSRGKKYPKFMGYFCK